jgi:peptidoglycan/xylan/chitin deacetylase (PgdA/CDA1 family)
MTGIAALVRCGEGLAPGSIADQAASWAPAFAEVVFVLQGADAGAAGNGVRLVSGARSPGHGWNLAVSATRAEALLLLDAGALPGPGLVRELEAFLAARTEPGFVCCQTAGEASVCRLEGILPQAATMGGLLVRRRLVEELGGFDEGLAAGVELEFLLRALQHGAAGESRPVALRGAASARREDLGEVLRKHAGLVRERGLEIAAGLEAAVAAERAREAAPAPPGASAADWSPDGRPGAAILLYHRVSTIGGEPGGPSVRPEDFRAQMAHLARRFRVLPLDALWDGLAAGALPERAVAVTLDDGYRDALSTASPVLVAAGVPATFFCTTAQLDQEHEHWWDLLEGALLSRERTPPELSLPVGGADRRFDTRTTAARRQVLETLGETLRGAGLEERERALAAVVAWSGGPWAPRALHRALTGREVRMLAGRPGHAVGAHSAHHLALPLQPPEVREREIAGCRRQLAELLHREVAAFAYPYGAYDDATVEAVRRAGFRLAVTVEEGLCRPGCDPLRLPRVEIRSCSPEAFAARLESLFASGDAARR